MNKKTFQGFFLVAILVGLLALLIAIFSPYATSIFWSVVLYIICLPPYRAIVNRLNVNSKTYVVKKNILAAVFAVGTVLIITTLLFVFGFLIIRQFIDLSNSFISVLRKPETEVFFSNFFEKLSQTIYDFTNLTIDIRTLNIKKTIIDMLSMFSSSLFITGKNFVQSTGRFVISLAFVCFSLYFFYVDGAYLASIFISAIPIETSSMKKLLDKFAVTLKQLFAGLILVALYQAVAAFFVFTIFGVKGSLLLGVLTFFAAFIPLLGSGIIWSPIAILIFFTQSKIKGIIFFVVAGSIISLMDNVLRPLILKDTIKIHPLLIFFSLLGGVKLLGLKGIILGPMTIIFFFAVLDLILDTNDEEETPPEKIKVDEQEY
ncbi:MAG: AI-2E family transporter [Treponemataceae bacterium]